MTDKPKKDKRHLVVHFGATTRNAARHLGSRAFLKIGDGGWDAPYEVDTHGLSPEKFAERVEKVRERHRAWAERMDTFGEVTDTELSVNGETFRIVDCTVPARAQGPVTLIVGVRRIVTGGALAKVEGWPVELLYESIEEIPDTAGIVEEVRSRLDSRQEVAVAHEDWTARARALITKP